MSIWKIWGITLIVASAYLALAAEIDYRSERADRCAVMHCT